jgi:hypothetical protein
MKKFLFFLLATLAIITTEAQTRLSVRSDTLVNADTAYATFSSVPSKIKSFQLDLNRISGSISTSGYALLQGTINGTSWVDVNTDTLKLANAATQTKVWLITSTNYAAYRACVRIPTGTQTSRAIFTYLRRNDE